MSSSSWIKLDQSFSKSFQRNSRNKRIHRAIVPANKSNIEDDSSLENYPCNLNSSSIKKRKLKPLENLKIYNDKYSSDESSEVDYNPDGTDLPKNGINSNIKPSLSFSIAASVTQQEQLSTSMQTNRTKLDPWKMWQTFPKATVDIHLNSTIDDGLTDSDDSMAFNSHRPLDKIDECSSDSSEMQFTVAHETTIKRNEPPATGQTKRSPVAEIADEMIIETEDSIPSQRQSQAAIETDESVTPPVQPFLVNSTNKPKKRKVRMVKGGMVEHLMKSLSKGKSDLLFWQHHRSAELVAPGPLVVVNRVEQTYGRTLLHTKVNNTPVIFSLCSTLQVEENDIIEVEFDSCGGYKKDDHVLYSYVDKVLPIK